MAAADGPARSVGPLSDPLGDMVAAELSQPQPEPVLAAARDVAGRCGGASLGVLFYGSCLRSGEIEDKILDFYVIVSGYRAAYERRWPALANAALPPNVFYAETQHAGRTLRAKYNVLSLADLERLCAPDTLNVSVWGRFSQPAALLLAEGMARQRIPCAVTQAVKTMLSSVLPLCEAGADARAVWTCALSHSYGSELRSEKPGQAGAVYAADKYRYQRLFPAALEALAVPYRRTDNSAVLDRAMDPRERRRAQWRWRLRRWQGKTLSVARLIKAAATFDGGFDYLAWKISRHSGVEIRVTPWRRRHPVLAGLMLFVRLRRKGAFR